MDNAQFNAAFFGIDTLPVQTLQNDAIFAVGEAFVENFARVQASLNLIPLMVSTAMVYEHAETVATHELTGKFTLTEEEKANQALKTTLTEKMMVKVDLIQDILRFDTDLARVEYERSKTAIQHILDSWRTPYFDLGMPPLYESLLIGSWTAIEVMIADLWEAAVNCHPEILASLKGEVSSEEKPEKLPGEPPDGKWIKQSALEMHGFNVANKMGTIWKRRFRFITLKGSIGAYKSAFPKDATDVLSAISSEALAALALIRNVLVHKAGKVDMEFQKEGGKLATLSDWTSLELGQKMRINGADIAKLMKPAVESGVALLSAVDEWLNQN